MVAAWILYSLLVTAVIAGAAWLLERALGEAGRPTRWAWTGGMAVALVLSLFPLIPAGTPAPEVPVAGVGEPVPASVEGGLPALFAGTIEIPAGGAFSRLDLPLAALWGGLLLLLLVRAAVGGRRLLAERREWRRAVLPEGEVLVSEDLGPAVVGIFRNEVVLPGWCLDLPEPERALIMAHEEEHRGARDTLLVALGGTLATLLPWNLVLGWMRTRLRTAVEVDCDLRVAGARPPSERHRYGQLLLLVGSRARRGPVPLATFAEEPSALARRIRMLTRSRSPWSGPRSLALAAGGLLLVVGACLIPGPDRGEPITGPEDEAPDSPTAEALEGLEEGRTFTPYDSPPELLNRSDVGRALRDEYPPLLREAGVEGTVALHFFIDEEGEVRQVRLAEPSGHPSLDDAALRVANVFRFSPALNGGSPVAVWVQIPIAFQAGPGEEASPSRSTAPERPAREAPEATDRAVRGDGPRFTPYEVAPEVRNRNEVARAARDEYPSLLRDAGIGGTAVLHFFIDEQGEVRSVELAETSGHAALDDAALRVADAFRFTPALQAGGPVPVWIQIPITFRID